MKNISDNSVYMADFYLEYIPDYDSQECFNNLGQLQDESGDTLMNSTVIPFEENGE